VKKVQPLSKSSPYEVLPHQVEKVKARHLKFCLKLKSKSKTFEILPQVEK
jgi:hypothetical protein